ncbi:hypothetical protein M409DRAFT_21226 [Zasmidium cellare ATCC 36951]|uniref:DNA-directed RNA polymerase III subunit RPC6 n=1 Tax=Zasmidium cellare ATCC 36951 TaxID=1080233 RepID=A0A6A6CMK1_ZASCE|nr:uncharacterized protein M409DRAFT_21226 [Zasmidium cellare ATCC 36951]KAF2168477.1 hypothetical protein M409DRAFT_21226 [Zasmidium cellare ATCC 36951]
MANSDEIANEADALYDQVNKSSLEEETGVRSKVFFQDELLKLAGVDNAKALMPLIQHLTNNGLFRTLRQAGKVGWSSRPREAARQIVTLDREDKQLYEIIEEAHTNGIWSRDLRKKTNMATNTVTKALNQMEKRNLIKSIKSVKNPAQRTYMLYHLVPSEDVTGNSFFDSGDLDESFRDELMNLIVFWVRTQSWSENKKKGKKGPVSPVLTADEASSRKRKRAEDIEDAGPHVYRRSAKPDPETDFTQMVYRAGTHNYPTAEDIHKFLTESNAIKPTKAASLTVAEIQGCIDVLCWGEKLERVPNRDGIAWGYRTVRGVSFRPPGTAMDDYEDHPGTGLTQAPCGRCPVFDLCHENGPVNPQECVYFDQWLRS